MSTHIPPTDPPETYQKIWVSEFFHKFPHFNFDFKRVNSTFNPESSNYAQALAFWAIIPVAVCFLLWLVFLIYFIFRCCQNQKNAKGRPSACSRVVTGLLIFIGIGLVAFGIYENESAHQGVDGVRSSVINANDTLTTASIRVQALDSLAEDVSSRLSNALEKAASEITNTSIRDEAIRQISSIRGAANEARRNLDSVHIADYSSAFNDAVTIADDVEYFRWMITIVIFCLYLFIFVLTVIGLLVKSKGTLIVCAAISIICSIFVWIGTGVYIGSSVGLGDACHDPDSYVISLADGSSSQAAVRAYIKCPDPALPYQTNITNATTSISNAMNALDKTLKLAEPFHIKELPKLASEMRNDLQYATGNLSTLLNSIGMCTTLHHLYVTGVDSACIDTIGSSALLALVFCILGILCTVIIFTVSCVWRQYSRKRVRAEYVPVDDTDPFLPRPPPYEQDYGTMGHSSPRPWSERGTLQHVSPVNHDDHTVMLNHQHPLPVDESPPPAYHPGQYVRQYADTGPTPNSIRLRSDT